MAEKKFVGLEGLRGIKKYISDNLPDLSAYCTAYQLQAILGEFVTKRLLSETVDKLVTLIESGTIGSGSGNSAVDLDMVTINTDNAKATIEGGHSIGGIAEFDFQNDPEIVERLSVLAQNPRVIDTVYINLKSDGMKFEKQYPLRLSRYVNMQNMFVSLGYEAVFHNLIGVPFTLSVSLEYNITESGNVGTVSMSAAMVGLTTGEEPDLP